jgi:DNA-directed RNA polymerase subunit L
MKIKILNRTKNELKIEVDGAGHTFCNVVQKALLKNSSVDLAGYDVPHPLNSSPVIYLSTKRRSKPEIVLREAVRTVQKDTKMFRTAFDKALKEWRSQQG